MSSLAAWSALGLTALGAWWLSVDGAGPGGGGDDPDFPRSLRTPPSPPGPSDGGPTAPAGPTKPGGSASPRPAPPPSPPPARPPRGRGAIPALPTENLGGRALLSLLPAEPTLLRDDLLFEMMAVRRFLRPITWKPVRLERRTPDGATRLCTAFVSSDALALGTATDFVRVNLRHPTAQRMADELMAMLPTTRISDHAWLQADVRLSPHPLPADSRMAFTERMLAHHEAIEAERAGRAGLVRTVGKSFVNTNLLLGKPERCAIFGWHTPHGRKRSPAGLPVVQSLAVTAHWAGFTDYSQTVCLVARRCIVDGAERDLEEVLRHPTDAWLVSDEGPLKLTRHPAVPPPRAYRAPLAA